LSEQIAFKNKGSLIKEISISNEINENITCNSNTKVVFEKIEQLSITKSFLMKNYDIA
jgi:hypothetical protein